jgi:hypothetical protein
MKIDSRVTTVAAFIFIGLGVFNACYDQYQRFGLAVPVDRGILQSNVAILALGVVALLVAQSLRNIENRLRALEGRRTSGQI